MSTPPAAPFPRFAYVDWMRGLACVTMFQSHCYDSWLNPEARKTVLYRWSQELSTLPALIFLFLCGVSFVLVTERLRQQKRPSTEIFKTALLRGAEIFGWGLLLRVQEFVLGYPKSPWTDLFRVDVLNILGVSLILMALFWRLTTSPSVISMGAPNQQLWRNRTIALALLVAAAIAVATPPLWTTHRLRFLPWMLESYINGVHIYEAPQPWLFSIFPWCGFAFVGLAFGLFILSDFARKREVLALALAGGVGVVACALSVLFDHSGPRVYAVYDYWHSSPNFFLMRCGILLILGFIIFAWCRWGWATKGFSPFIQFGKTSLLVYWAHIEFVYGRLSILPKRRSSIPLATLGMVVIFAAMLGLSIRRTRSRSRAAAKLKSATSPTLSEAM